MSIILDALRKSEADRQRQAGPGIADAGFRPGVRQRSAWLPLLVLVLAANLVVIGYLLWRDDRAVPPDPPVPAAPSPAATSPSGARPQINALRDDAPYQVMADLPAVESQVTAGAAATAPIAPATPAPADGTAPAIAPEVPAIEAAPDSGRVREGLPTAEQLTAQGVLSLPPLHVDIHVFSATPAERFVFINTRKYTEGALLSEGPRVEEITSEGVVLSQGGQRFMLMRD